MARLADRIFLPIWPDMEFASTSYVYDYRTNGLIAAVAHSVLECLRTLEHKKEPCDRIVHIIVKDPGVSLKMIRDEIEKIEEWVEVKGQLWFTVSLNVNQIFL